MIPMHTSDTIYVRRTMTPWRSAAMGVCVVLCVQVVAWILGFLVGGALMAPAYSSGWWFMHAASCIVLLSYSHHPVATPYEHGGFMEGEVQSMYTRACVTIAWLAFGWLLLPIAVGVSMYQRFPRAE